MTQEEFDQLVLRQPELLWSCPATSQVFGPWTSEESLRNSVCRIAFNERRNPTSVLVYRPYRPEPLEEAEFYQGEEWDDDGPMYPDDEAFEEARARREEEIREWRPWKAEVHRRFAESRVKFADTCREAQAFVDALLLSEGYRLVGGPVVVSGANTSDSGTPR